MQPDKQQPKEQGFNENQLEQLRGILADLSNPESQKKEVEVKKDRFPPWLSKKKKKEEQQKKVKKPLLNQGEDYELELIKFEQLMTEFNNLAMGDGLELQAQSLVIDNLIARREVIDIHSAGFAGFNQAVDDLADKLFGNF
jgi:hypothetical protein